MEVTSPLFWTGFHLIIILLLYIDLKYYEKAKLTFRDSLIWTIIWIGLGLAFSAYIYWIYGTEEFIKYITAYVTEKTLSLDNVFVFLVIFSYFSVPERERHFILFLGIIFAALFRAVFILVGVVLLERFHWMTYVFGIILVYSGLSMWKSGTESVDPEKNKVIRFLRNHVPIVPEYNGIHMTVVKDGKRFFTPMILVLAAIETTDIMFAFDSVPAVLAITREFFTAYTSNIMAILGLRALYFLVEHGVQRIKGLSKGLSVYLIYLGIAFLLTAFELEVPSWVSLLLILAILGWGIMRSERSDREVEES